jgi:hypothetical protein
MLTSLLLGRQRAADVASERLAVACLHIDAASAAHAQDEALA